MVKLSCAIVGVAGGAFDVDIDASRQVSELKDVIHSENPQTIQCDAAELRLWWAMKADVTGKTLWLPNGDEAAEELKKGAIHLRIQALISQDPLKVTRTIAELMKTSNLPDPLSKQIHVLVKVPDPKKRKRDTDSDDEETQPTKLSTFDKLLKQCPKRGSLPRTGDFLQLFEWNDSDCGQVKDIKEINDVVGFTGDNFFVRREILCVLENFKIFIANFDSGKVRNQFVLMGSPGVGKSCMLALLCFYVAVTTNQPVLWFRAADDAEATTRLFYEGEYYEWAGNNGEIYKLVYMDLKLRTNGVFWPCLDGFNQDEDSCLDHLDGFSWGNRFTLLATSGSFLVKSSGARTLCLLPYWRRSDLESLARKLEDASEEDVSSRCFVSGGSLREFLRVDARQRVMAALSRVIISEHATTLLRASHCTSDKKVERLRTRGVEDASDTACYVNPLRWRAGVTSSLALRHLATVMKPNFFENLVRIAREMKDDRLEDAALEGYFHTLVWHGRSISIDYYECKSVEGKEDDVNHDTVSISGAPVKNVSCSGDSVEACVRMMEEWAKDPLSLDYWIPADSLCDIIDAVVRWKFPDGNERICFLQLTKNQTRKCDADILWKLAQPFVDQGFPVCYNTLLPWEHDCVLDRGLKPALVTNQKVLDHIHLYVARYRIEP